MSTFEFFPHNWVEYLNMVTEWTTQVDVSEARLAETRRNLVDSPRRTISIKWSGLEQDRATRLLFELMRAGEGDRRIPLYQDQSVTTASSSGTTVNCPTDYRRFYVGQLIVIATADGETYEYGTISALTSSTITLSGALTGTFPAGSRVFPVLICDALLDAKMELITDMKASIVAEFSESSSRYPESGDWDNLSSYGFTQIDSFAYLLGIDPEWSNGIAVTMDRPGRIATFDRVDRTVLWGPRGVLHMQLDYAFTTRAEFWSFLQFFDAHRGRALPFWVENPLTMFQAYAVDTAYLDVVTVGQLADYTSFVQSVEGGSPYLLIRKTDGTKIISRVTGVTSGSGYFRLACTLPSMSLSDISRVSLAFFVRFDTDSMVESWATDQFSRVSVSVVELLRWEDETSDADNDGYFTGGVDQLCD